MVTFTVANGNKFKCENVFRNQEKEWFYLATYKFRFKNTEKLKKIYVPNYKIE